MSDLESRVAGSPAQALRLAPGTGRDDAAAVNVAAVFRLSDYAPVQVRNTMASDEDAAKLPGVWLPSPTKPGFKFRWELINLSTGEVAWPER